MLGQRHVLYMFLPVCFKQNNENAEKLVSVSVRKKILPVVPNTEHTKMHSVLTALLTRPHLCSRRETPTQLCEEERSVYVI